MHCSLDFRTAAPQPFLGYFPALFPQSELEEGVHVFDTKGQVFERHLVGPPRRTEALAARDNYETKDPHDLSAFGPTRTLPLGDIVLARSGDKGANVNIGLFVHTDDEWNWLRSFLTRNRMKELMGSDWRDWFYIERVEFEHLRAVHFVIYGALGRGVSSSARLDSLGKGFAEFIRYVHVEIPVKFLPVVE